MPSDRNADTDLVQLGCFGNPDGPSLDEAMIAFARLRASPAEGAAVRTLLAVEARKPLPEPLLLAVASALADRGDEQTAAHALARATTIPGRMLRAELLSRAGDLPGAIALAERVLLQDLDWPGARERHTRWSQQLGLPAERDRGGEPVASATLATSAPQAPFRLLREVGRGGAGAVYQAEDRDLGRPVALKVYHRPDRDRAQLLHEARVAAALEGPGIIRVFDVDPEHGWLAMEWARHGALRTLLRNRDPALLPLARWAVPLARSLGRVHAAGWVHHDVKPANVLVREPDAPLLSDLGTARRAGEASPPGSMGYVSPERLAGRASHRLDDIYGFGRILEDSLDIVRTIAIAQAGEVEPDVGRWTVLAAACTASDDERELAFDALLADPPWP